jgi:hypothetical protein
LSEADRHSALLAPRPATLLAPILSITQDSQGVSLQRSLPPPPSPSQAGSASRAFIAPLSF